MTFSVEKQVQHLKLSYENRVLPCYSMLTAIYAEKFTNNKQYRKNILKNVNASSNYEKKVGRCVVLVGHSLYSF